MQVSVLAKLLGHACGMLVDKAHRQYDFDVVHCWTAMTPPASSAYARLSCMGGTDVLQRVGTVLDWLQAAWYLGLMPRVQAYAVHSCMRF